PLFAAPDANRTTIAVKSYPIGAFDQAISDPVLLLNAAAKDADHVLTKLSLPSKLAAALPSKNVSSANWQSTYVPSRPLPLLSVATDPAVSFKRQNASR